MRIPSFGEFVETQKTAEQASPSFNKSKLKKNEKTKKKEKLGKLKLIYTNADQLTNVKKVELLEHIKQKHLYIVVITEMKPKKTN